MTQDVTTRPRFHPQVTALLALLEQFKSPPIHTIPIAEARATVERAAEYLGGPSLEVDSVKDFEAQGPAGPITLRMYRPNGVSTELAPAVLYFHGGGWVVGSLASYDKVCRKIAAWSQCVVLSVDYRLAPEHLLPASAVDAIAATAWVSLHAAELGLDPKRLAVAGDSAGGSLAAVCALAARDAGIPLGCQILIYPTTDTRDSTYDYASHIANGDVPLLDLEAKRWFTELSHSNPGIAEDWRVSPLLAPDVSGLPPTLMFTAERDILHDEAVLYANRLEEAGVEIMRQNLAGMTHGFLSFAGMLSAADEAIETLSLFLRQKLSFHAPARKMAKP